MLVLKGMGKSIPSIVIRDALMNAKSLQLRPTLCDIMDYSLPGSSVHSILQARILEWVAISFSKGFSGPRDQGKKRRHSNSYNGIKKNTMNKGKFLKIKEYNVKFIIIHLKILLKRYFL